MASGALFGFRRFENKIFYRIMYELEGVTPDVAERAMWLCARKFGIKTRFVSRDQPLN